MPSRRTLRPLALALTLALAAGVAFAQAPTLSLAGSVDAEMERLNRAVPGFGGMFYDSDGVLNVVLRDPSRADFFRQGGVEVRARPGRYEFVELERWRQRLRPLLAMPGVVSLDVDEVRNRVRLGVDPAAKAAARDLGWRLARSGVPHEAVEVVEAEPIHALAHDLTHSFSPVPGGVEINFSNFLCTLGFNVRLETGGNCFFVTNDHCTDVQGQSTGTVYFQPFLGPRIGVEVFDPPFFTGGQCPAGRICRFSDAAAARYDDPANCEFGAIAKTPVGSTAIDPTMPRWAIVSKQSGGALVGQLMAKEGRTTGRTEGNVSQTCADTNVSGSNITRLCQTIVLAGVGGGDSGSPVFRRREDQAVAQLSGILWGGNGAGTLFVYSPIANVEQDFGRTLPVF